MVQKQSDISSPSNRSHGRNGSTLWGRIYISRLLACVLVLTPLAFIVAYGAVRESSGYSGPNVASSAQPASDPSGTNESQRHEIEVFSSEPQAGISGKWDGPLDVREWSYTKPIRVAHRKNSHERVVQAASFDAIEADLRGATKDGTDFKLFHDTDHGYTLRQFLADCKKQEQIAILDLKGDADPVGAVRIVSEEGMIGSTVFQVPLGRLAKDICDENENALCWFLNGGGQETSLKEDEIRQYAEYLVGVNVCGTVVGKTNATLAIPAVHAITGRYGDPLEICIFAYGTRTDVYGNDAMYTSLGVDCMMTDVCPTRAHRGLQEID